MIESLKGNEEEQKSYLQGTLEDNEDSSKAVIQCLKTILAAHGRHEENKLQDQSKELKNFFDQLHSLNLQLAVRPIQKIKD